MKWLVLRDVLLIGMVIFVSVFFAIVAASHVITLPIDLSVEALPVEGGFIERADLM